MVATKTEYTLDDALAALLRLGRRVRPRGRRHGRDRWLAQCPAHDDNRHSLSLAEGERVPLLLKCHAGCTFEEVMAVLRGRRPPVPLSGRSGRNKKRHRAATPGPRSGASRLHWYDYRDEQGRLLYQHGRTPDKQFPFRMPGAPRWGLKPGLRRLLYRLPDLVAAAPGERVFVVEGEKDADRLAALGLVATCNDDGAGKWPAGCDHHFRGLHVVILPDNDPPGAAHAQLVARRLAPVAASVRIVTLPELPPKGDVSDWLDAGRSREELERELEREERGRRVERGRRKEAAIRGRWPAAPAVEPDGFVVTVGIARTSLAPIYEENGSYRDAPMQRHRWVLRHGKQVVAEAEVETVYVLCLSEEEYGRFKNRQYYRRREGQRREWWGVPQVGGCAHGLRVEDGEGPVESGQWTVDSGERGVVVFHTDPAEGGEVVPGARGQLYRLIDGLVNAIPEGRNPKGTKDWGRDYRSSRGDGRELDEAVIIARASALIDLYKDAGPDLIAPFTGMRKRTFREIKAHAGEAPRRLLLGMLRDELQGKGRKSVLALLHRHIRKNNIQLWSRDSIYRAASALDITLDPISRCGLAHLAPEEAYRRLQGAGLALFTRTGRSALRAFLEWVAPGAGVGLWDPAQGDKDGEPVQDPVVLAVEGENNE